MEVHHLTKLHFYRLGDRRLRAFAECMSSFAGIRSLTIRDDYHAILHEIAERLTILTQLTELSLVSIERSSPLRLPMGIVNLQLGYAVRYAAASPDMNECLTDLTSLTNLTSLSIKSSSELRLFQPGGVTPSQFSRQLSKLKYLETIDVRVDDLFLDALAYMTGLTKLCLVSRRSLVDLRIVCPRLTTLSNLEVLKISCDNHLIDCLASFQIGVPQTRLPLSGTGVDERREVWQMYPRLRKFSPFGRSSVYG